MNPEEQQTWSYEEHFEELRNRLIICFLFLLLACAAGFFLTPPLLYGLKNLAPEGTQFFQIKPGELFFLHFRLSLLLALLLAGPFWGFQLFAFLDPGLKRSERNFGLLLLWLAPLLFFLGIAFCALLALRPMMSFLLDFPGFNLPYLQTDNLPLIAKSFNLEEFVNLAINSCLGFGFAFEIPLVLALLVLLGILETRTIFGHWRPVVLVIFVLSALLTPTPDVFNMLFLALGLGGVLAITLLILALFGK